MKTEDLIAALAADAKALDKPLGRSLVIALGAGALVSLAWFMALIGPRPDFMDAMHTMRFDLKFIDALCWATPTLLLCLSLSRPQTNPGLLLAWLIAPLCLLAAGVAIELALAPRALWDAAHRQQLASLLDVDSAVVDSPLGALIAALRAGAPRYPALTGALAGAAAAGVGAHLCDQLHRRFAAVRRQLVPPGDADRRGGGRAGGAAMAEVVRGTFSAVPIVAAASSASVRRAAA